mgnify:CR=1 FL=1
MTVCSPGERPRTLTAYASHSTAWPASLSATFLASSLMPSRTSHPISNRFSSRSDSLPISRSAWSSVRRAMSAYHSPTVISISSCVGCGTRPSPNGFDGATYGAKTEMGGSGSIGEPGERGFVAGDLGEREWTLDGRERMGRGEGDATRGESGVRGESAVVGRESVFLAFLVPFFFGAGAAIGAGSGSDSASAISTSSSGSSTTGGTAAFFLRPPLGFAGSSAMASSSSTTSFEARLRDLVNDGAATDAAGVSIETEPARERVLVGGPPSDDDGVSTIETDPARERVLATAASAGGSPSEDEGVSTIVTDAARERVAVAGSEGVGSTFFVVRLARVL